jgi:UDP-N-acetylglucosamine--N-acetylmuramyl-(pentapeptide) pyrophosphoryl-undecaprenol N-acetylglucosamine transferase
MELFYAACDLVIARAGGAVAELTATATPAILVPGGFGSGHHQAANAGALAGVGAAEVVAESEIGRLPSPRCSQPLIDCERWRKPAPGSRVRMRPG